MTTGITIIINPQEADMSDKHIQRSATLEDRIIRLEEKLGFLEHDFEQVDGSVRELGESVDAIKRSVQVLHDDVKHHATLLRNDDGDDDQNAAIE